MHWQMLYSNLSYLFNFMSLQASQQRDLKPSLTSLSQSLPTASSSSSTFPSSSSSTSSSASQSSSPSQLLHNLPPGISVQKGTEPQSSSPSQVWSEVPITKRRNFTFCCSFCRSFHRGSRSRKASRKPQNLKAPLFSNRALLPSLSR